MKIKFGEELIMNIEKKYHIITFGCQMNENDSEKIAGILTKKGYTYAEDSKDADVLVINTCSVRGNADDRFFGNLGQFKAVKQKKEGMIIAVCGCMMQQEIHINDVQKRYPFVDIIFGTHNVHQFGEFLDRKLEGNKKRVVEVISDGPIAEDVPMKREFDYKAYVTIMNGCDNFCTYCIVPYTRGREKSRPASKIIQEIRELADNGCKEVMLLGQNVNSYGKRGEITEPCSFAELLDRVSEIEGIERIRFMTSHPKDLTDDVIEAIARNEKVMNSVHLPLQSGSSRVLKLMNRKYDKEKYLQTVEKLRERIPDISITTDIIVGFPTETEEDFAQTLDVVEKVRFDSAFTFIYSPRHGTKAASMEGAVDDAVVKVRFEKLMDLLHAKMLEQSVEKYEGKTVEVLVDGHSQKDENMLCGKTRGGKLVNFHGEAPMGTLVNVKITKPTTFHLLGEVAE
ncbi:MAG: tRNA (N6-isopentenyl adenosine(37)-C2)-methylthiotransferase MiaB [Anaerofustis stercorihominis]|nr:tRNA (N6-isopentenyl adenosine(37)-C2)-methylthiotransferase MiaB [Anaerofustis stercorihominis]